MGLFDRSPEQTAINNANAASYKASLDSGMTAGQAIAAQPSGGGSGSGGSGSGGSGSGGTTPTPTPTASVADQINSAYEANYGRPGETAGVEYWTQQAKNNPGMDIGAAIAAGARGQDISAHGDMVADNLGVGQTWDGTIDKDNEAKYYDAYANKWVVEKPKVIKEPWQSSVNSANYGEEYVNPNSMASKQAADILTAGHPLLEAAQVVAKQGSNDTGMVNTTQGVTAGTQAVTNVAKELGINQAGMYGDAQKALQNHDYASDLSAQNHDQTSRLVDQKGDITKDLSTQNFNQTKDMETWRGNIAADFQTKQNAFTLELSKKGWEQDRINIMSNIMATQSTALMNNISRLMNNPDIELSNNAISMMSDFMYASWKSNSNLIGLNIEVV